ncbi:hypothetical protein M426DRAFT_13896 [Hypoxylon sp. CI-4A]|nr:hypothetical protein M426DRAFT_13896 [Hypoxylon sp. CI-4A]
MKSIFSQLCLPVAPRPSSSSTLNATPDIVTRLPFELHIFILAHLEPKDIDVGLSTCRGWRDIWLSDEIWPRLARKWFPGLEEHIRNSAFYGLDQGEMFRRALHRIQRRVSGKFASAVHYEMRLESEHFFTLSKAVPVPEGGVHNYDDVNGLEFGANAHFPRFMVYNGGRIGWWPEAYLLPYLAVVDDLRTRKRRAYLFPNNKGETQGYRTAMSDKLLLMGRGKTLHAWHLDLDRLSSAEFPEEFVRCIPEGDTTLIVTKNAELYLWKFGREPVHVDVTGCYEKGPVGTSHPYDFISGQFVSSYNVGSRLVQNGTLLDFIISPTEDNVFFVITYRKELQVHEIRCGELAGTYCLTRNKWTDFIMEPVDFTNLRWEKIDSYGGYCLMQAISKTPHPSNADATREATCPPTSNTLVSVCFNIYTKRFTIPHYHHTECHNHQSACQIWNSRIAASDMDSPRGPVMSLRPCASLACEFEKPDPTPFYTAVQSGRNSLLRRQRILFEVNEANSALLHADFALDSNQPFDKISTENVNGTSPPLLPGIRRLVGDDDFLLLIDRQSYTVWSFGNEIPGKMTNGGQSLWRSLSSEILHLLPSSVSSTFSQSSQNLSVP